MEFVDNKAIREAVLREGCSLRGLSQNLKVDEKQLRRSLGIDSNKGKFTKKIKYDTAVEVCREIGFDPIDLGL